MKIKPPEAKKSTIRPWPAKKRILVAAGFSLVIIIGAGILGTGWYRLGRHWGWFTSQNIATLVTERLLQNPEFRQVFARILATPKCVNPVKGFLIDPLSPFTVTPSNPQDNCSELTARIGTNQFLYLKIVPSRQPAAATINQYLTGLREVNSNTFGHPKYPGTIIIGYLQATPVTIIVLRTSQDTSWSIVAYPSTELYEASVEKIAQSFQTVP